MKSIHTIALTLLCATFPGLPAGAADEETIETAMLSAEPLSTDLLRIQMFGAIADAAKPDAKKEAAPDRLRTVAPVANTPALRELDAAPKVAAPKINAPTAGARKPAIRRADTRRIAAPTISADTLQRAVQRRLSEDSPRTAKLMEDDLAALVEYYAVLRPPLLWVDDNC